MVEKIDTQVKAWKGIAGNPECNSDNKRALANMKENEDICTHILEELENIGRAREEDEAKKAKN
jgi:hypothetical protein